MVAESVGKTLIQRYILLIKTAKPLTVAKKNPEGSLELSHLLWMLEKMSEEDFEPKTSDSHWLGWVQAGLYQNKLISIRHEKDVTREILKKLPRTKDLCD